MSLISRGKSQTRRLLSLYTRQINQANVSGNLLFNRTISTGTSRNMKGMFKLGLTGLTVGALMGTGYSWHYMNSPSKHIINEEVTIPTINEIPKVKPSRKIVSPTDHSGLKLVLYQYQTCPFCCKVRAFLDYHGFSYDVVEVDPVLRQDIKWSPYKKVPILVAKINDGYQPLNDSTMIISALASFVKDKKNLEEIVKCYPQLLFVDEDGRRKSEIMNKYFLMLSGIDNKKLDLKEINDERKWRKWADDVLVHTLSPNIYRTRQEALQAFDWFSQAGDWERIFPTWERLLMVYVGASAMWVIGKRLKKKYALKDDVRESLYDNCNQWTRAINTKGTKFMGGNEPNLADLSVYGILSSIEGCDAFKDVLKNTKIANWYYLMKETVNNRNGGKLLSI